MQVVREGRIAEEDDNSNLWTISGNGWRSPDAVEVVGGEGRRPDVV